VTFMKHLLSHIGDNPVFVIIGLKLCCWDGLHWHRVHIMIREDWSAGSEVEIMRAAEDTQIHEGRL
jgi:hypothetical protein